MMNKLPKHLADFATQYGLAPTDFWEVRSGAWAILHKALERVAAKAGILFDPPQILEIDTDKKLCALVVTAKTPGRMEWATGEAAPHNNKNAYPVAMAEKRAKDRAALKLLSLHGDLYSESELDDANIAAAQTNGSAKPTYPIRPLWTPARSKQGYGKLSEQMIRHTDLDTHDQWWGDVEDERTRFDKTFQDWLLYGFIDHGLTIAESWAAAKTFIEAHDAEIANLEDEKKDDLRDRAKVARARLTSLPTLAAG
jgi:hypothetical protein